MKKTKLSIKKLILIAICVLIPLLSGYFIATYAYNRYRPYYFSEYMENIEEDTEAKLNAYLEYYTYSYEEVPYIEEVVEKDSVEVLTFRVYRAILTSQKVDTNLETYTSYDLTYIFVIYNINYQKLVEIEDPTLEKKLSYDDLPQIYVTIQDNEFNGNETTITMGVPEDTVFIDDYNSSPEEDYRGRELNSRFLKWGETQIDTDFSDDVTVEVYMTDSLSEEDATYHSTILQVTKTDFYQASSQLDFSTYKQGYNTDYEAAGYLAHVFKTRIWWQSLIAIALMGLITFSFYIVWNAEELQNATKKESKK